MFKRWLKLEKDLKMSDGKFDISKVPDIYDMLKYDYLHNFHVMNNEESHELFERIRKLSQIIMPLEFGLNKKQKIGIALRIVGDLLKKVHHDLLWWTDQE